MMSNNYADYVRSFIKSHPDSPPSNDFFTQIPKEIADQIIPQTNCGTEEQRNVLIDVKDIFRERFFQSYPAYAETFKRHLSASGIDSDFSKVMNDDANEAEKFRQLFRVWRRSQIDCCVKVTVFPDFPPATVAKDGKVIYKDETYKKPIKVGKVNRKFIFPSGMSVHAKEQHYQQIYLMTSLKKDDEFEKCLTEVMKQSGLKTELKDNNYVFTWASYNDMMRNEEEHILWERKFSKEYEEYLATPGRKLTARDELLKSKLSAMLELEEKLAAGEGVSSDPKYGMPAGMTDEEWEKFTPSQKKEAFLTELRKNELEKLAAEQLQAAKREIEKQMLEAEKRRKAEEAEKLKLKYEEELKKLGIDPTSKTPKQVDKGETSKAKSAYDFLFDKINAELAAKSGGAASMVKVAFDAFKLDDDNDEEEAEPYDLSEDEEEEEEAGEDDLFSLEIPGKIVVGLGTEVYKDYSFDVNGVRTFMADNDLDEKDLNEVIYSIMIVKLIDGKAIRINSDEDVGDPPKAVPKSLVSESKLKIYAPLATKMVDTTMFYVCQGAKSGSLSWYDSFCMINGKFCSERRFISICEMIAGSGALGKYIRKVKVGYLRSLNNLYKYRINRISTADLIFRALGMISEDFILRMINREALEGYYRFTRAGIVAQVASGPLKVFCKGRIQCMKYRNIHPNVTVPMLAAIEEPPYNARLIKQAKIILEVYGVDINNWYQGDRAMGTFDSKDQYFKDVVRAFKEADAERSRLIVEAISKNLTITDWGSDTNVSYVKGMIAAYNT